MAIRVDSERCVHFHELLYRVMRRLYGNHELLNKAFDMQVFEMITQNRVLKLTEKTQKELQKYKEVKISEYSGIANPMMSQFQTKQALKAWVRFARGHNN